MKYLKYLFLMILIIEGCSLWNGISSQTNILPNQYAVLDSSQAYKLVSQCSRYAPIIEGSWNPSAKEIKELENNISEISLLTADNCCLIGEKVNNINNFLRQYVGIIIKGEKFIYINAFPKIEFDELPSGWDKPDWRREAYIICDGGPYYWGAIFNPRNKKFSDLAFNGVG